MALEKAIITNTVTGVQTPVMFNPEDYTVNRENNFAQAAIPGLSAPILQFIHGNMQTLEMELFLDTYEQHTVGSRVLNNARDDVRKLSQNVVGLMDIDATTHAPPILLFTWASLSFTCVLARASQKFVMFLSDGTPVRAKIQVTFNEFRNVDLEAKEVKRETSDFSKRYVVGQGETLATIAWAHFGDPRDWRPIALANAIDDPRRGLTPGMSLVLPQLPYRDPDSGKVFT
jgi:nucleoid-associated protein YgaU